MDRAVEERVEEEERMSDKKPCKFAVNPSGSLWECGVYQDTECAEQKRDMNPDGSVNVVECLLGRAKR